VLRAEGAAHGPARGPFFRVVPPVQAGRAGPAHSPTSLIYQFFLTKVNFFHKSQNMKEAAYNFIVLSKTYLNSQVILKRKGTKSQHIEKMSGPYRATGRPGRATTVLRAEGAAHGPVRQRAGPPVARKHRTGPKLTGQMYIYGCK